MTTTTAPKPQPRKEYFYDDDRAGIAAGYRHLADLIESGQAPLPVNPQVSLFLSHGGAPVDEQPAAARDLMRALGGGKYEKDVASGGSSLILRGSCAGLPVDIWVSRDAVCERVVTGTTTVTETVPVGEDTRPVKTVTREVETFEWRCGSLLDAATENGDTVEVAP